jgi:hypothetical protein
LRAAEEGAQREEVFDQVVPYVATKTLESDDGGGGFRGLRQIREHSADVHVEEGAGDLVDRGGSQQTGEGSVTPSYTSSWLRKPMSPPGSPVNARSSTSTRRGWVAVLRQYQMRPHNAQSASRRSRDGGAQPGAAPGEPRADSRHCARYSGETRANC